MRLARNGRIAVEGELDKATRFDRRASPGRASLDGLQPASATPAITTARRNRQAHDDCNFDLIRIPSEVRADGRARPLQETRSGQGLNVQFVYSLLRSAPYQEPQAHR